MKAVTLIQALMWLAYPVVIFFGIHYFQPRYIAIILTLLLIFRWRNEAESILQGMAQVTIAVFLALLSITTLTAISNSETLLRLYPALVNCGMLLIFSYSLKYPPSMVERFARLHDPALTPSGVSYTHRVTQVWCLFFVFNGCFSTYTALYLSRDEWSLYNGFIAYILMGAMFTGEWIIRRHFIAKNTDNS